MEKLDLKKTLKSLYTAKPNKHEVVTVPELSYLMIDGEGDPNNSKQFSDAIEALYSVSYNLKFALKKQVGTPEYTVMPLEGLWWCDDMTQFSPANKAAWKWTLMILQPDFITNLQVREAISAVKEKKGFPALSQLRFEKMNEGECVQVLHVGPFSTEPATIGQLHEYIHKNGYELTGKHREIYLSDMRRTAPEKLKTIIRQPVKR